MFPDKTGVSAENERRPGTTLLCWRLSKTTEKNFIVHRNDQFSGCIKKYQDLFRKNGIKRWSCPLCSNLLHRRKSRFPVKGSDSGWYFVYRWFCIWYSHTFPYGFFFQLWYRPHESEYFAGICKAVQFLGFCHCGYCKKSPGELRSTASKSLWAGYLYQRSFFKQT